MVAVGYIPSLRAWSLIRKSNSVFIESFRGFGCSLNKCNFTGVCSSCKHRIKLKPYYFSSNDIKSSSLI